MMMMTNIILGVCRGDDDGSDDVDDDDGIEHLLVCPTRVGHVSQAHHLPQQDSKRPDIRLQGKWQKLGLGHQINFKCANSKIISDCTRVQCTKIISHNTERLKTWIWNPAAACFLFFKSHLCSEDSVKKSLWRHPFDRQHCFPTFPVTFNCFCYCCHSSVLFVIVVLFVLLFCLYREIGVFPKYEGESDSQDMKPYSCWYWHDIRYGYDTSWLHIATRQRRQIFFKRERIASNSDTLELPIDKFYFWFWNSEV